MPLPIITSLSLFMGFSGAQAGSVTPGSTKCAQTKKASRQWPDEDAFVRSRSLGKPAFVVEGRALCLLPDAMQRLCQVAEVLVLLSFDEGSVRADLGCCTELRRYALFRLFVADRVAFGSTAPRDAGA
jgi:hypothetical protein